MTPTDIVRFLLTAVVAGLLGGGAMGLTMWLITRAGFANGNMIVALGSLLTKSRATAFRIGAIVHSVSAIAFSIGYLLLMLAANVVTLPGSVLLGIGVGFVHGMIVSLMLVWVIAEHHPLEEFKEADLAIGLTHLVGHVAFGGVVGLVVGIATAL